MLRRHVVVHGRVQGVFFRDTCRQEAARAGVAGWVANEPDGTVRAVFEGDADAVEAMVAWCHEGSPHASVSSVDVTDEKPEGLSGFHVR